MISQNNSQLKEKKQILLTASKNFMTVLDNIK